MDPYLFLLRLQSFQKRINRESYMSAHVLLNLLNELKKQDKTVLSQINSLHAG